MNQIKFFKGCLPQISFDSFLNIPNIPLYSKYSKYPKYSIKKSITDVIMTIQKDNTFSDVFRGYKNVILD